MGWAVSQEVQKDQMDTENQSWLYQNINPPERLEDLCSYFLLQLQDETTKMVPGKKPFLKHPKWQKALHLRLGLNGKPKVTLVEAGQSIGVTRERVRQVQKKLERIITSKAHMIYQPYPVVLMEAIRVALDQPLNLGEELYRLGLARHEGWDYESLALLAGLSGDHSAKEKLIEASESANHLGIIKASLPKIVWEMSENTGFSQLPICVSKVSEDSQGLFNKNYDLNNNVITQMIESHKEIIKLPDGFIFSSSGSSILPSGKVILPSAFKAGAGCRVPSLVAKQLKITTPLPVSELLNGINRYFKFKDIAIRLPKGALTAFLNFHQEFRVESSGLVHLVNPLESKDFEDQTKEWLVRKFETSDYGILTKAEIFREARNEGMNTNTLSIYLSYNCEFRKVQVGRMVLYYLVGRRPDEQKINQALKIHKATYSDSELTYFFNSDKRTLLIEIKIGNTNITGSHILNKDNISILDLLGDTRYRILDSNNDEFGFLTGAYSMNVIKGLQTYFSRKGVGIGEIVKIEVNLERNIARGNL